MKDKYKVVIVGAGPAGLSTALNLLKLGEKDLLVIERFEFPRYKCCAGYITAKTKSEYKKLGLDVENCNYSLIKDFNICYKYKSKLKIINKFLFTNKSIDRVELDNAFFNLAVSKGIEIAENAKIAEHEAKENAITLSDGTRIAYENLVFADGTNGFGSRYQKFKKCNFAMQLTFSKEAEEAIHIHFGKTKRGYGWVSSFGGTINVGLTDVYNPGINYNQVFAEFLDELDIKADLTNLKGAFTPIGVKKPIIFGNVFFVGDAVGACDPLTLSGLRYGLKSGEVCAKSIVANNSGVYLSYIKKLKFKFRLMKTLMKIFYLKPILSFGFNVFCRLFGKTVSKIFNNFFVNKK
ncbi:MAG: NAD(P)/FAD-dependent oxidoreductase [Clostridia bacterium]|nr:NAD(P)/FAD-dependent oxidoreductase [Clostridia bacterium]